jgi:pimeloyl-ACP methyl ester carboxylesterase
VAVTGLGFGAKRIVNASDGEPLAVWDNAGEGDPVVFVHGFPENHHCWEEVIGAMVALTPQLRFIAYDLRGHGASSKSGEASLQRFYLDHQEILTALGVERYHLVGHDWGGAVGLHEARYRPERLRSLVVLNTNYWETHVPGMWHMLLLNIPVVAPIAFALAPDAMFHAFIERSLAAPRTQQGARMESYRASFHDRDTIRFWIRLYRSMAGELLRQTLPPPMRLLIRRSKVKLPRTSSHAFRTPTLIVWGALDTFNPMRIGYGIERHLKSFGAPVELVALEQARHFVAEDQPQEVARLVSAHIATRAAAPDRA